MYSRRVGLVGMDVHSSAMMDAVSEYYINFGMLGVLLLSITHGWYLGIQSAWLTRRCHYLLGASMFAILTVQNMDSFGWIYLFGEQIKKILPWLVIFYAMSAARRRV